MGKTSKVCPCCNHKMRQQFIGLQHCQCGMSWLVDCGFFERTADMKFCLQRHTVGKKVKQVPVVRYFSEELAHEEFENELKKDRTLFAVFTDESNKFSHVIKFKKKNKKSFRKMLESKGYEVHYIFSRNEVEKVKAGEFVLKDIPPEVVLYLVEHLEDWETYLKKI